MTRPEKYCRYHQNYLSYSFIRNPFTPLSVISLSNGTHHIEERVRLARFRETLRQRIFELKLLFCSQQRIRVYREWSLDIKGFIPPESIHEESTYNIRQRETLQRRDWYDGYESAEELRKEPEYLDRSHGFVEGVGFALIFYSCNGKFFAFYPAFLNEPDDIGPGQNRFRSVWGCRYPELDTIHQNEVTERMRPFALALTDPISCSASTSNLRECFTMCNARYVPERSQP